MRPNCCNWPPVGGRSARQLLQAAGTDTAATVQVAAVNDALVNYGAAMANALADRNPQLAGLHQQLAAVGARAQAGMDAVLAESLAMSERIAEIGLTLSGEAGRDPDEDSGAGPE